MKGNHVLMVSGSDSHGTPVTVRAEEEGVTPKDIFERYHNSFLQTFDSLGIHFGKALQMTNILRDIPADLALGRCYIPNDRLSEIGLNHEDLHNPDSIDVFRPLYDSYLDLTCDHYDSAINYIRMIPRKYRSLRMACMLPVVIGLETLALLRTGNVLDAYERIKVDRGRIKKIAISCSISTRFKPMENRILNNAVNRARNDS